MISKRMGRIRTKEIKHATFSLIDAHPGAFSADFEKNKAALAELKISIESKRDRNKVAGYIARVMRTKKASEKTTAS